MAFTFINKINNNTGLYEEEDGDPLVVAEVLLDGARVAGDRAVRQVVRVRHPAHLVRVLHTTSTQPTQPPTLSGTGNEYRTKRSHLVCALRTRTCTQLHVSCNMGRQTALGTVHTYTARCCAALGTVHTYTARCCAARCCAMRCCARDSNSVFSTVAFTHRATLAVIILAYTGKGILQTGDIAS